MWKSRRSLDRIDITDPNDVGLWAMSFGVSPQRIIEAVRASGTNIASKVREHLDRH